MKIEVHLEEWEIIEAISIYVADMGDYEKPVPAEVEIKKCKKQTGGYGGDTISVDNYTATVSVKKKKVGS